MNLEREQLATVSQSVTIIIFYRHILRKKQIKKFKNYNVSFQIFFVFIVQL